MNKKELIDVITAKAEFPKKDVTSVFNATIEAITEILEKGESLTLIGFGSFKVVDRKAREGRHPKTGEKLKIPARKAVKFSVGKTLKENVQKKKKSKK
jgi:nucleoid DNA-binding protein